MLWGTLDRLGISGDADGSSDRFRFGGFDTFIGGMLGDARVLSLFAGQYWVASIDQLRELGIGKKALRRGCEIGLVEQVTRGVYRVAAAPFGLEGRCMALLLKTPPGSFVSGTTAGRLYGLRKMPASPVEVTVPFNVKREVPSWARLVRCEGPFSDRDVVERDDGIVIASPLRTLFRLAACFNRFRFERAAEDMWHLGLVTPSDAAHYLAEVRRSGRTGVAKMERWLRRTSLMERPSESGLEQMLLQLVTAAGLPEPARQQPVRLLNGDLIHIDMAWPDVRFGLEPGHSWWHGGDLKMRSDQARDRACTEVGWHIARFDEVSVDEPGVADQIRRIYRQRAQIVSGTAG